MLPFLFYLASLPYTALSQDLSLYGFFDLYSIPVDTREIAYVYGKCFYGCLFRTRNNFVYELTVTYSGLGFRTCLPDVPTDQNLYDENLPYYNLLGTKAGGTQGVPYCTECCGTHPNNIDVWNLTCPVDFQTILTSNVYGYELRLATNGTILFPTHFFEVKF